MDEQPPLPPEPAATSLSEPPKDFIDVERVFTAKNPRLARWIPGFVFSYLRRVVHQPEVNAFLYEHWNDTAAQFTAAVVEYFQLQIEVRGLENLLSVSRPIVASNHPLGGLDGVLLLDLMLKQDREVLCFSNDILLNLPPMRPLFIPVNKHGSNKENIALMNAAFAGNAQILYFPAGLVSRKQSGVIADLEWQKTFITKALQSKRPIVPTFVTGRNSDRFYRLANWRKFLGIKANIEMLYLADEMFRQKSKHIQVTFGQPIAPERLDKSKSHQEWALAVRELVYRLPTEPNASL